MGRGRGVVLTDEQLPPSPRAKDNRKPDKPRLRPVKDGITEVLGATYYVAEKRFDDIRETLLKRNGEGEPGNRFTFRRFYPEVNVIVDLVNVDTDQNRKLVEKKREAIIAYNEGRDEPIGYIPLLASQRVPKASFDAAKSGRVLELPARNPALIRAMEERGYVI